jgi:predicted membrane protein (TIGR00267 family)
VNLVNRASFLLDITRSHGIARRYFVVNGFDGALTMLGIIIGFYVSEPAGLGTIISACLGAAIALGVSGVSSAYISESAERRRALLQLEEAMLADLRDSHHGDAARWVPLLIAVVNGAAPLLISLLIITPLWLSHAGVSLPLAPLHVAILVALILIFLLGVFLGRVAGISWLHSGIRTLLVALLTAALIYLFAHS